MASTLGTISEATATPGPSTTSPVQPCSTAVAVAVASPTTVRRSPHEPARQAAATVVPPAVAPTPRVVQERRTAVVAVAPAARVRRVGPQVAPVARASSSFVTPPTPPMPSRPRSARLPIATSATTSRTSTPHARCGSTLPVPAAIHRASPEHQPFPTSPETDRRAR